MVTRSNPIPDTLERIPGFGTLCIYMTPSSGVYQMRCYLAGKLIKRTTKTKQRGIAIATAKQFYHDCLVKQAQNQPLTVGHAFKKVADALLEEDQGRVERGERKKSLVRDVKYILDGGMLEFFKNDGIRNINYDRIGKYVEHLKTRGKKPVGSNTIKNHFIILRKVLKHAHKMDMLDKMPIFPTISIKDNPREWFTNDQYTKLLETCTNCEGKTAEKTYTPITKELRLLCAFLVNTYLRPPDIRDMKNKDITVIQDADTKVLRINAKSKVVKGAVISMPPAVTIYAKLTEFNKALGFGRPNDYVFFPALSNRGYAFQTIRLQFNYVLDKGGLKKGDDATPRTLYSLRHSAIMFRLINGGQLDMFTLAKNCRTSVDMLQRFYVSHLEAEMKIHQIIKQGAKAVGRQI